MLHVLVWVVDEKYKTLNSIPKIISNEGVNKMGKYDIFLTEKEKEKLKKKKQDRTLSKIAISIAVGALVFVMVTFLLQNVGFAFIVGNIWIGVTLILSFLLDVKKTIAVVGVGVIDEMNTEEDKYGQNN